MAHIAVTEHLHKFENGNAVSWTEMCPRDSAPSDLMICMPTALASSLIYTEFAVRMVNMAGLRVVIIDLPAHGRSYIREGGLDKFEQEPVEKAFFSFKTTEEQLDFYLKDIVALVRLQGWDKVRAHWVGTSNGSTVTTHFALKYPEWFKSCINISFCVGSFFPEELRHFACTMVCPWMQEGEDIEATKDTVAKVREGLEGGS